MNKYHITTVVYGTAYICIEAETREEAIDIAMTADYPSLPWLERPKAGCWDYYGNDISLENDVAKWEIEEEWDDDAR